MTSIIPQGSQYIPAIGDDLVGSWLEGITWKDKNLRFFERDQSFFYHPYLLMSAYYMITNRYPNHRQDINYPEDTVVIGDSGGFQILSFSKKGKQIDVTPLQVLRWLENNVDIGMNLDSPPDYGKFDESLRKSVENFKFFEQNRHNYSMKLYNVLHGGNYNQISTWYEAVKDFSFDGWAIGIHPSTNVYLKLIGYLFLLEKGEESPLTNTHFFGVSGPNNMLSLALLSDHFNSSLTFDSSSWSWGQRFRDYWFSYDIRHCVRLGRLFTNSMNDVPCDCPVCKTLNISQLYDQNSSITPQLLSFHNMHNAMEVNRIINCMVKDDEVFDEYAKSLGEYELIVNSRNIIKDWENHDSKFVYDKYKSLFSDTSVIPKESSIFGFDEIIKRPQTIYSTIS